MLVIVSATQKPGGMRAEDTVKDFWATRPRRPRRGRKIAGVAAGIANRYRIDPVLVRVGLVVAALYGGAGLLVYLLGWLLLPEEDDEAAPLEALVGKGRSSTSTLFTLLLCAAMIPVFSWFSSGFFAGWLGVLVAAGLLYLLHQNRGHVTPIRTSAPVADPIFPTAQMPMTPAESVTQSFTPPAAASSGPAEERTTPPAWDPLGAAPFAWDLPEPDLPQPEEPEPPQRRRKSRVGSLTVGTALVVVAILLGVGVGDWWNPTHIVGIVLAILGLGMVVGSFFRGGRGLIGLAVPLAVIGLGMTSVSPEGFRGVGEIEAYPTSIRQVQEEYVRSVGTIDLDLTGLPSSGEVRTEARLGVGNITVIVPEDADVELTCRVDLGNADCLEEQQAGPSDVEVELESFGRDGEGGLQIDLEVETGKGNVEVRRG